MASKFYKLIASTTECSGKGLVLALYTRFLAPRTLSHLPALLAVIYE